MANITRNGYTLIDNSNLGTASWIREDATGRSISNVYGTVSYNRETQLGSDPCPAEVAIICQELFDEAGASAAADEAVAQAAADEVKAAELAEHIAYVTSPAYKVRQAQAARWDALQNEGHEGYNPYR